MKKFLIFILLILSVCCCAFSACGEEKVITYTLTVVSDNSEYGDVSVEKVENLPVGTTISAEGNKIIVNGTEITATPKASDDDYVYKFISWVNGNATLDEDLTVTACFTRIPNKFTVSIDTNYVAYGSVSTKKIQNVRYGTLITSSGNTVNVDGTTVTATAAA